jgi:hypothetical protein
MPRVSARRSECRGAPGSFPTQRRRTGQEVITTFRWWSRNSPQTAPLVGERTANIPDCGRPLPPHSYESARQLWAPPPNGLAASAERDGSRPTLHLLLFSAGNTRFRFSRGPQRKPSQGQGNSKICFRLPSGGFGALLMLSNHWPTTRCSSSVAMWLSRKKSFSSGASIIILVAVRTSSVVGHSSIGVPPSMVAAPPPGQFRHHGVRQMAKCPI